MSPAPLQQASPLANPQQPADLLLYRLAKLSASSGRLVTRLCERQYGVTRREWGMLMWLAQEPGLQPSVLAERLELDRARVSRAIASLQDKRAAPEVAHGSQPQRLRTAFDRYGSAAARCPLAANPCHQREASGRIETRIDYRTGSQSCRVATTGPATRRTKRERRTLSSKARRQQTLEPIIGPACTLHSYLLVCLHVCLSEVPA